ncbi:serine hydrolase [Streptomyces sp. LN699]|uniref:D-alanyl-D-alanine carboxypeptidase n=1 Tax=Streptomyces sp. LN699 TaxID=3112981 RepID=UPI00371BAFE0
MKAVTVADGSSDPAQAPETSGTTEPEAHPQTSEAGAGRAPAVAPVRGDGDGTSGVGPGEAGPTEDGPEEAGGADAPEPSGRAATPGDGREEPEPTPEPAATAGPGASGEPEEAAVPERPAGTEETARPDQAADPEGAAGPERPVDREATADPEDASDHDQAADPEDAADPDPAPEGTPEPARSTDSEETSPAPESPSEPGRKPRTEPAAPDVGTTPDVPTTPKSTEAPTTPNAGEGSAGEATGGAATGPDTGSKAAPKAPRTAAPAADPDAGSKAARTAAAAADPDAGPKAGPGAAPKTGPRGGSPAPASASASSASASAASAPVRVPSWARENAHDAERTSEFVALKALEAPTSTPTPARAPVPARTPMASAPTAPAPAALVPERTREVPQPPQPPLDLLAELTNTPPPTETTRRTALRRVKIWTPIVLVLAGCFTGAQLMRPLPEPKLVAADSVHTVDGQLTLPWPTEGQGAIRVPGSGDIAVFGEQRPVPTASVAKVMTAYVILKDHPLAKPTDKGPDITVDAAAVADGTSEDESRIEGLKAGATYSQQDMLKMLMIPSGNNVARLLARWDSGTDSQDAFVAKMNAAAAELGMKDTVYTDPSGLDKATVSTAVDQLRLAEAVMKNDAFRAIVKLPNATIPGLPKPIYNNNDSLLTAADLSVKGIKTGSSTAAGGTLLWASFKSVGEETPLILGTMMDQHADGPDLNGGDSLKLVKENSRKVIEAVRKALASTPVIHKGQVVGHVDDGLGGRTPLVATKDLNAIGVPGQQLRLTLGGGAAALPHTAKAGAEVGVLTVGDGAGAKTVPVAVGVDLAEPSFVNRLTRLG